MLISEVNKTLSIVQEHTLQPGAVSGNFRCGEFFPKAVGRWRGVGQSPTERRRRKFLGGLIGFYSIFN